MNTTKTSLLTGMLLFVSLLTGCKKSEEKIAAEKAKFDIDSTQIDAFFVKHPEFKEYSKDITELNRKNDWRFLWYDEEGRNDFAEVLYDRARQIEKEGVPAELPYQKEFSDLFDDDRKKPDLNKELLISSMYFFYAKKVYDGLDPRQSKQMGWFLPRQRVPYAEYLAELMKDPDLLNKDEETMIAPYYQLRKSLQHYRVIRDKGGWGKIEIPKGSKGLKPGDTGIAVAQLRKRLVFSGDLAKDSGSRVYDSELTEAVRNWEIRHNLEPDGKLTGKMIDELNIPVEERIKTIIVNMERCRWVSPSIYDNKEFIAVNIPSYTLDYTRNGKRVLHSNVVVGKELNKTVVFSGKMSYLVFSPYWNVPKSILEKEIKPALEKDPGYLEKHNMEWHENDQVRQRPGPDNSLGLVKFMFPNSNNIYLHDSPAKSLFNREERAFSHGCVRVQKARELAIMITDDLPGWNAARVDEAMNSGTEQSVPLKRKIPVYIAYFTAWPDEHGHISFYEDIYKRDARLAHTLYQEEVSK